MADFNTGIKRTLTIIITKYYGGDVAAGYPKTYDGKNSFTWNGFTYSAITNVQLQKLSEEDYLKRLDNHKSYVESQENTLDIDAVLDINYPPFQEDITNCVTTCEMYFEVVKRNQRAKGHINKDGVPVQTLTVSGAPGSSITITGVTLENSTIYAWSTDPSGLRNLGNGNTFTTTLECSTTCYLILDHDTEVSRNFCYYPPNTVKDDICKACNYIVTVYYDKSDYDTLGFENIMWYSDSGLTESVLDGFYKEVGNITDPPIYTVTDGLVTAEDFCDSDILYCSV